MSVPGLTTREAERRLTAAGCVAAAEEAVELRAAAADAAGFERLVSRREGGEPLAWITGSEVFCGARVAVAPGVYVPRRQSEELARRAARALEASTARTAADLCTGSGAVAVHLGRLARARVVGIDLDPVAAACARSNGVPAVVADAAAPPLAPGRFDVVTAVPPYVPTGSLHLLPRDVQRHEPRWALDGGTDGLDVVREVVPAASVLLRRGGWLFLEIGGEQDRLAADLLTAAGFSCLEGWWDDDGDLRGVAGRSP